MFAATTVLIVRRLFVFSKSWGLLLVYTERIGLEVNKRVNDTTTLVGVTISVNV